MKQFGLPYQNREELEYILLDVQKTKIDAGKERDHPQLMNRKN